MHVLTILKKAPTNIWDHRQLLYFLVLRDIKVRYQQAFLGIAWAILTPTAQALILTFVFDFLLKVSQSSTPYLLIVYTGFIIWNFLSQAIGTATYALIDNYNLVTKAAFPKEILILASIFGRLPDLLASLPVLILLLLYYQINLSITILLIIPIILILLCLIIGLSFMFSAANVYFRDFAVLVPLFLTLWLYLTPVIYPIESIPQQFQLFLLLNPMSGIVESSRNIFLTNTFPNLFMILSSFTISIIILVVGYLFFKKLEKGFADVI